MIITRDLAVIRNHTDNKSQGHKIGVKTAIRTKTQSNELPPRERNKQTERKETL